MGVDARIPSVYDIEKGCTYVYHNMPMLRWNTPAAKMLTG